MLTIDELKEILPHSENDAVTNADLVHLTGETPTDIRLSVEDARLHGAAICSSTNGYWLSSDPSEIRRCIESLTRRIGSQAKTIRAMRKTANRLQPFEKS